MLIALDKSEYQVNSFLITWWKHMWWKKEPNQELWRLYYQKVLVEKKTSSGATCMPYIHCSTYLLHISIATDRAIFFIRKMLISFLFLHENIHCGYSLEVPRWGASNEYPQHMFLWRNKKNIMWIPRLICSYVYPYKCTVKQFPCLQITAGVLFVYFFIKAYVMGTQMSIHNTGFNKEISEKKKNTKTSH